MTTSRDVRESLVDALRLDLIGPRPGHSPHAEYAEEVLTAPPSVWYLTGFLVPYEAPASQRSDDDSQDELDQVGRLRDGDDERLPEGASKRRAPFPSSIGLSVLVSATTRQLSLQVDWADYRPFAAPAGDSAPPEQSGGASPDARSGRMYWRRMPHQTILPVSLRVGKPAVIGLADDPNLKVVVSVRDVSGTSLVPAGTRAVSVFLVNYRPHSADALRDAAFVFQPELVIRSPEPLVPRPDLHGQDSQDWDELVADLQFQDAVEYVVGHNIAGLATRSDDDRCAEVRSAWMPTADVEKVIPRDLPRVKLEMEGLATAPTPQALVALLTPLVTEYDAWLEAQSQLQPTSPGRRETAQALIQNARRARTRIAAGIQALEQPQIFRAFQLANLAIARAIRQRACHGREDLAPEAVKAPAWRPFQLAFLLMNIPGSASETHPDRSVVDLLFFPTGGGKTEAYLGLAAFVMVLRRLRDPSVRSAGVTILMRYTLRLLTLDQLGRAATLICALELLRQQDVESLGRWPFEIGLWVGQSATPNRMGKKGDQDEHSARARTIAFQNDSSRKPSPIPLEDCPWCGWKFNKDSFKLLPNSDAPTDLRVGCHNRRCEFHFRRQSRGLPVLAVDDPIYRRLPAFLIATVDKFAGMPWVGEVGALFGRVERFDSEGFYGASQAGRGSTLAGPLPPPALIIQDELHLISGPLGTMVGLYETAVDALASQDLTSSSAPRPKIVASTATVRRAERQIQALFGRASEVFPPPGIDRRDSFFALTARATERHPRLYVGVAAQGRNSKVVLLRTYLTLMGAAQRAWESSGGTGAGRNPADPYMTLLGYFNSLRELGGSRRIVEDEVTTRLTDLGERRRRQGERTGLLANRPRTTEPCELTSRVSTGRVADTRRRLGLSHSDNEHVDVALATNMISVGLDITRLGLMVVLGQPKTTSEYIQATSRVGRDEERPGLVVTLLNLARPRDRSHYERFAAWHESFYRSVEATSVTPFSPRAIDRGIPSVTVALARHGHRELTAPRGAYHILKHRTQLDFVADLIARRAEAHDRQLDRTEAEALRLKVKARVQALLDAWSNIASRKGDLQYQREIGIAPPLLFSPLDPELERQPLEARQFKSNRSLRDVEPAVHLWVCNPDGFEVGGGDDE